MIVRGFAAFGHPVSGWNVSMMASPIALTGATGIGVRQPLGIGAFAPNVFSGIGSGPAAFPLMGLSNGIVPGGQSAGGFFAPGPVTGAGSLAEAEQATAFAASLQPQPIAQLLNLNLAITQWGQRNASADPMNGPQFNNAVNFLFGPQNDMGPRMMGSDAGTGIGDYLNPLGSNPLQGFMNTGSQGELNGLTNLLHQLGGQGVQGFMGSNDGALTGLQNALNQSAGSGVNGFMGSNNGDLAGLQNTLNQSAGSGVNGFLGSNDGALAGLQNALNQSAGSGVNGFVGSNNGELGGLNQLLGQTAGSGVPGYLGSFMDPLFQALMQWVGQMGIGVQG